MTMPLEGYRVIDWTIWQQGPVCSAMLGDMGAEVIKIEDRVSGDPGRGMIQAAGLDLGDRPNFYFEANNRNKKSLTVDLKKPEGREIVDTTLPVCSLCKTRPAQPRHPFCLSCRLELNKAIGSAKGELCKTIAVEHQSPERMKPHQPSGLADALARKRRDTSARFTPRNKYS